MMLHKKAFLKPRGNCNLVLEYVEELLAFIGTGKYDFDAFPDLCQSAKLAQILS